MGVPRLFRWLVERYPLLLRPADQFPQPAFDNLYLDFNGIIHACTHGNSKEALQSKSDKEIMFAIFGYIEVLFNIVKPKKLLMIAVDGVAPRAKMNTQRQRRFKSAKDRLDNAEAWDSNAITPGTEFMTEMATELKFFVQHKINNDPEWKAIQVMVSGPDVPGEGEHKISEYIRKIKTQPGYDPTTSHCLYGLDADLIMLALATHEPYFYILREQVISRRKKDTPDLPKKTEILLQKTDSYQFFSVSLLREYLQLEFPPDTYGIQYNLERIIDDFVFLCFFIGNDFIPGLPFLEIDDGLVLLIEAYRDIVRTQKAHLVDAETTKINMPAVIQLLNILAKRERKVIEDTISKSNGNGKAEEKPSEPKKEQQIEVSLKNMLGITGVSDAAVEDFKKDFYHKKLGIANLDLSESFYAAICQNYIESLIWTLSYYYQGHLSWRWYYGYLSAPFLSDILSVKNFTVKYDFEMGTPFTPLQQLLAVLPPQSSKLLPSLVRDLVTNEKSPLIEFYPVKFDVIEDDKGRDWKHVPIIPFIDEKKLLDAYNALDLNKLTSQEKERDKVGSTLMFYYTKDAAKSNFKSKLWVVEGKPTNHAKCVIYTLTEAGRNATFKPILVPSFDPFAPPVKGFPTIRSLMLSTATQSIGINMVGSRSKAETRLIVVHSNPLPNNIANMVVGKRCYVDYPFSVEAEAQGLLTAQSYCHLSNRGKIITSEALPTDLSWPDLVKKLEDKYKLHYGITFSRPIDCVVYVKTFEGMKRVRGSGTFKKFSAFTEPVPLQLIALNGRSDPRYQETMQNINADEEFPAGAKVAVIGQTYYGSTGIVVGKSKQDSDMIDVQLDVYPSESATNLGNLLKEKYYKGNEVAQILNVGTLTISRITGTITFVPGDVDIGLGIKYSSRDLFVPGYARKVSFKTDKGTKTAFEFSERAVTLLKNFKNAFPDLFAGIDKDPKQDQFDASKIFGEKYQDRMLEIIRWLATCECSNEPLLPCNSLAMPTHIIQEVEKNVGRFLDIAAKKTKKIVSLSPFELYNPTFLLDFGASHSKFDLGNRVVYADNKGAVPFGQRGTIVTIHDNIAEVLFDQEFLSATNLQYRIKSLRGGNVPLSSLLNLSVPTPVSVPASAKKNAKAPAKTSTFNPFDALNDQ